MKKLLLILIALPMIGFGQLTYVPDDNFEQELINLGYDNILDDSVITANIDTVTYLNVDNDSIADLTGIEDFTSLTDLSCRENQLTNLDVSTNTALTSLDCYINQLTNLDVSTNTSLEYLTCGYNQLISLDVTNNTALVFLYCRQNQLTSLDVSQNTVLTDLYCGYNQLTNLSLNISLVILSCSDNQLTSLDVTNNTALFRLWCNNNQITSLDVTNNTALSILEYSFNQLTSIDVSNITVLTHLGSHFNQLTSLDVSNNSDLTALYCSGNLLTSLDVSLNIALVSLSCSDNQLTSLDVTNNTDLLDLNCNSNQITSLDLSNNPVLWSILCFNNQLTSLDLRNGNNTNFYAFWVSGNPNLYCIDVDNPSWSTTNWSIDTWMSFSSDCSTAFGCTDNIAFNYNPSATIDDGSCLYCFTIDTQIISNVNCFGGNNGMVTVIPLGGTSPFQYSLGGGLSQNIGTFAYLAAGIYYIDVTDANNCTYNIQFSITQPNLDTSSITITACDTYSWNGTPYTISGAYANTYTNSSGCDSTHTLNLTINNSPNTSNILGVTNVSYLQNETYSVGQNLSSIFTWHLNSGGIILNGINTNSAEIQWGNNSGTFELYLVNTAQNGCSDTVFINVTVGNSTAILEHPTNKELLKVTDLLGRQTKGNNNEVLFYIYDDGTVEKRIVIE